MRTLGFLLKLASKHSDRNGRYIVLTNVYLRILKANRYKVHAILGKKCHNWVWYGGDFQANERCVIVSWILCQGLVGGVMGLYGDVVLLTSCQLDEETL